MVTVIFRAKMRAGKEDEAIKAMSGMVASVQSKEPDAVAYVLHRSQEDPSELVFYESYKDDETLKAHMATPHMTDMRAAFGDLFDGATVKIERLERVAGFAR